MRKKLLFTGIIIACVGVLKTIFDDLEYIKKKQNDMDHRLEEAEDMADTYYSSALSNHDL